MTKVRIGKELSAACENKVGMLAEVSSEIAAASINIQSISAYAIENKAFFRLITDNNQKAKGLFQAKGYEVSEQEVLMVELPNQVGILKEVADKLKAQGIDLKYIYGTTCSCDCDCFLVLNSNDNLRAEKVLKE